MQLRKLCSFRKKLSDSRRYIGQISSVRLFEIGPWIGMMNEYPLKEPRGDDGGGGGKGENEHDNDDNMVMMIM